MSAYVLDQALREWGDDIKANYAEVGMSEELYDEIVVRLKSLVDELNLDEFFELPLEVSGQLLELVAPRKPSENIFSPEPSEVILEFLNSHTACLGEQRKGVKLCNLEDFVDLNPAFE